MNGIADGAYTGAVLYANISEARPVEIADAPLDSGEVRSLAVAVTKGGGAVMEAMPHRMVAFFPVVETALATAREIIRSLAESRRSNAERRGLDCRIVLGFGQVTIERGRLRSDWTHRLHGQVLRVPQNTIAALPTFVERFDPADLRHRRLTPSLFSIETQLEADESTRLPEATVAAEAPVYSTITLRVRGRPQTVRSSDCPIQVGRDPTCGVQLAGEFVSRVHGRIEFFNDKFHYVDASRNGSYVLTGGGDEVLLKREKVMLVGEGAISPGVPISRQTGEVLRYQCNSRRLKVEAPGDTQQASTTRERATTTRSSLRRKKKAP